MEAKAAANSKGRSLRFLANVDPVGAARALDGCNPETTLAIVISKTFTTAETMLNARTVREWLISHLGPGATPKHMIAVSTNVPEVTKFGIDPKNIFEFWDWVRTKTLRLRLRGLCDVVLSERWCVRACVCV